MSSLLYTGGWLQWRCKVSVAANLPNKAAVASEQTSPVQPTVVAAAVARIVVLNALCRSAVHSSTDRAIAELGATACCTLPAKDGTLGATPPVHLHCVGSFACHSCSSVSHAAWPPYKQQTFAVKLPAAALPDAVRPESLTQRPSARVVRPLPAVVRLSSSLPHPDALLWLWRLLLLLSTRLHWQCRFQWLFVQALHEVETMRLPVL